MDLLAERGRRVTVDELNTTRLLAHCPQAGGAAQARRHPDRPTWQRPPLPRTRTSRKSCPYMENEVLRRGHHGGPRPHLGARHHRAEPRYSFTQDMGGRASPAIRCAHRRRPSPASCATCSWASAGCWTP